MIIANQRIRLAVDCSQMGTLQDIISGASPQHWNGVDIQYEIAFFYGQALASINNFDQVIVELKASDPRTGLPLYNQSVPSNLLNQGLSLSAWQAGAPADCHCLAAFTNAQTNLDLDDDTVSFWLVISALTSDSPPHKIVLGATPLNVVEGGEGVTPPATVVSPLYLTSAQSDARYSRTVDLTSINNQLSTINSSVTTLTTTANGALQRSGGTMTGALTITGLSGVLKATAGLVAGSATTSDLGEGTNLFWTQGRFNTALAAVSGAASGVCPLDSGSLIPAQYLPSITVHDTFVVNSQAAMLALAAHQGDVAIRTDLSETFILVSGSATVLANWAELLSPTAAVASVNGLTGAVVLTTTNITEGTNLYYTTARAKADALAAALTGFSAATGGTLLNTDSILAALGKVENRLALDDAKLTGSDRVLKAGDTMTGALLFSGTTNAGVVLNSLTSTQRGALTAANGMLVYDSTLAQIMCYVGSWSPLSPGGGGTTWFADAGAPAAGLGQAGNWYLNESTGDIYQNNLVVGVPTWQLIYSPSVSGFVPIAGGTMTAPLQFSGNGNAGLRLNNLTTTQQNALTAGAGTEIFNTTLGVPSFYNGSTWNALNVTYNTGTGKLQFYSSGTWNNVTIGGVGGGLTAPRTVTVDTIMSASDSMLICNGSGLTSPPGISITLPTSPIAGQIYYVKNIFGGFGAWVYATNGNIDGTSYPTAGSGSGYVINAPDAHGFMYDGTNWWVATF